MSQDPAHSETSETLTERGRGTAERAALGRSPFDSIARIVGFIVLFILVGGTIFYFLGR